MRVIFLILIGLSSIIYAGTFNRSNGVVSDSNTNLEWQDDYSDNNNSIKITIWQSAIDYCENLTLNTQNDWRLPTKNELLSIVDYTKNNPSIAKQFKNTSTTDSYWSSTTIEFSHSGAWIVYFGHGNTDRARKASSYYVRCVRAGK